MLTHITNDLGISTSFGFGFYILKSKTIKANKKKPPQNIIKCGNWLMKVESLWAIQFLFIISLILDDAVVNACWGFSLFKGGKEVMVHIPSF